MNSFKRKRVVHSGYVCGNMIRGGYVDEYMKYNGMGKVGKGVCGIMQETSELISAIEGPSAGERHTPPEDEAAAPAPGIERPLLLPVCVCALGPSE